MHRLGRRVVAGLLVAAVGPLPGTHVGDAFAGAGPARLAAVPGATPSDGRIDPRLQARLDRSPTDLVDTLVVLSSQADLSGVTGSRAARLAAVETRLRNHAATAQAPLLTFLREQRSLGTVQMIRPLWITNEIEVTATAAAIAKIAAFPDVLAVRPNATIAAPSPPASIGADGGSVEPNVSAIHAPELWSRGFRGQHTVVASMDTGVDATHPDLAGSWRGGSNSWYDPNGEHPSTPTDVNGHGTQTMGVMVGGTAGGSSIGVAPDATWIAVKIFNDHGTAATSAIHLGFQWLLNPDGDLSTADAPNVVNDSWSGFVGGCSLEFQPDLAGLRAAGIVPVFAAGNNGPSPGTVFSPANLSEALAVGGTDNTAAIDPESSRGPSACTGSVAPAVAAPGVGIRTTDLYGGYLADTGTSVAAPHVSGAIALLLSAFPGASADRVQAALEGSAVDLGSPGADPDFGYGWVDADAAYQWMASEPDFTVSASPSAVTATAGTRTDFTVSVAALHGFSSDVALSLTGLSTSQATWSFAPDTISGAGDAQLAVTTNASLAEGVYPLTVTATSGALTRSAHMDLTVQAPPDFTISAAPLSASTAAGGSVSYTVSTQAVGGMTDQIALSVTGLPASVGTATLTPSAVTPGGTSQLGVSTIVSAPAGTYPLTVTGVSGQLTHSAPVSLTVTVTRDFGLSVTPSSVTVRHGKTASYTVTITSIGGLGGKVAMSATGAPAGTVAKFGRVNVSVPGSTIMRIRTYSATRRGSFPITVTAKQGSLVHQVVVGLTVT